jgi:hypothetical protein
MKLWMDVQRDLEYVMNDYQRIFAGWAEGGVDGVVFGPPVFNTGKLLPTCEPLPMDDPPMATFDPNPAIYRRLQVDVPETPEDPMPEQRALLQETLEAARNMGFEVYIMYSSSGASPGGDGYYLNDEKTMRSQIARMVDTLEHFPMADGAIMDGPEWGYEIAPHHQNYRSYFFNDLPADVEPLCAALGYDYHALVAAKDRLLTSLHNIDVRRLRVHGGGGFLGGYHLLGGDPDLAAWMSFRVESLTAYYRNIREGLAAEMSRPVRLGCGPRSSAFSTLCGYDYALLAEFMDFLLPKHYFWNRGFDGFVGTVFRYAETLCHWNPGLETKDALIVVEALFGIVLPGVEKLIDFEHAFSPEFFEQIVGQETRRAVAAVDDPNRIVPWLEAGRFPHDGDPLSPGDLQQILDAADESGLERFLYHHQGNLTAGEWTVISEKCGKRWNPMESDFRPADMMVL